jgi:hypothetical protein
MHFADEYDGFGGSIFVALIVFFVFERGHA